VLWVKATLNDTAAMRIEFGAARKLAKQRN
jgi:hypothetical protein